MANPYPCRAPLHLQCSNSRQGSPSAGPSATLPLLPCNIPPAAPGKGRCYSTWSQIQVSFLGLLVQASWEATYTSSQVLDLMQVILWCFINNSCQWHSCRKLNWSHLLVSSTHDLCSNIKIKSHSYLIRICLLKWLINLSTYCCWLYTWRTGWITLT